MCVLDRLLVCNEWCLPVSSSVEFACPCTWKRSSCIMSMPTMLVPLKLGRCMPLSASECCFIGALMSRNAVSSGTKCGLSFIPVASIGQSFFRVDMLIRLATAPVSIGNDACCPSVNVSKIRRQLLACS